MLHSIFLKSINIIIVCVSSFYVFSSFLLTNCTFIETYTNTWSLLRFIFICEDVLFSSLENMHTHQHSSHVYFIHKKYYRFFMYVITELNLKGIQKQVCIDEMHKRRKTFRKYLASFTPEVNITYNLSFHAFIKPESDSTGLNQFFKSVFKGRSNNINYNNNNNKKRV